MILGIDTSSSYLSLALCQADGQFISTHQLQAQRHGETILPEIERLFKQSGHTCQTCRGVAVGLGPGSFTGVRIGVATALGLAQALNQPIVGLSSFVTVAANQTLPLVLVMGDARREKVYAGLYRQSSEGVISLMPESLLSLDELMTRLPNELLYISGPDSAQFFDEIKNRRPLVKLVEQQHRYPKATSLIKLAIKPLADGGMTLDQIKPIYLRKTQAEEMLNNGTGHQAGHS